MSKDVKASKNKKVNNTNKKENLHKGHRERVKENFLKCGLEGFHNHEILELLLFFGIPMKDTNEIAHQLLDVFGSFSEVLNARYEDLVKIKGMTSNAAVLLTMLPQLYHVYTRESLDLVQLDSVEKVNKFFISAYSGVKNEEIKVCCLDSEMKIISCGTVIEGTIASAKVDMRKIVEIVFRYNSDMVIIAHNHPNGTPVPSDEDIIATRAIKNTFDSLGITLVDHVVVGRNMAVSMKNSGYFSIL